jgi:hypothetical protein
MSCECLLFKFSLSKRPERVRGSGTNEKYPRNS